MVYICVFVFERKSVATAVVTTDRSNVATVVVTGVVKCITTECHDKKCRWMLYSLLYYVGMLWLCLCVWVSMNVSMYIQSNVYTKSISSNNLTENKVRFIFFFCAVGLKIITVIISMNVTSTDQLFIDEKNIKAYCHKKHYSQNITKQL